MMPGSSSRTDAGPVGMLLKPRQCTGPSVTVSRAGLPLDTATAWLTPPLGVSWLLLLMAGCPVREVGGYPGLVQVVGLTARLGGRDRALVIRESEMSQHAPDRLLVTIWAAQLLVEDLVGRQPELVV